MFILLQRMYVLPNVHNCIVYDIGTSMFRAGLAGHLLPHINRPSSVIYNGDNSDIRYDFDEFHLLSMPTRKEIVDIFDVDYHFSNDLMRNFIDFTHKTLNMTDEEKTCVFSLPVHLMGDSNYKGDVCSVISEFLFETFNYRRVSFVSDAVLSCFSYCVNSALVIDFGWSCTRITPVIDCIPRLNNIKTHIASGQFISKLFTDRLKNRGIYLCNNLALSKKQMSLIERKVSSEIILGYFNLNNQLNSQLDDSFTSSNIAYAIGDMFEISEDSEFFSKMIFVDSDSGSGELTLPKLIDQSVADTGRRKTDLLNNIVLSGGYSTISGLRDLIEKSGENNTDMRNVLSSMHNFSSGEFCTFTGGSILGASEFFDEFSVSREEFGETGPSAIIQKLN